MICPYSDPSGLGWWSGSTVCIPKYCNLLQGLPLGLSLSLESHALHWVFASHSILGGARPFGGRGVNCPNSLEAIRVRLFLTNKSGVLIGV
jgi:hypothetical protein